MQLFELIGSFPSVGRALSNGILGLPIQLDVKMGWSTFLVSDSSFQCVPVATNM